MNTIVNEGCETNTTTNININTRKTNMETVTINNNFFASWEDFVKSDFYESMPEIVQYFVCDHCVLKDISYPFNDPDEIDSAIYEYSANMVPVYFGEQFKEFDQHFDEIENELIECYGNRYLNNFSDFSDAISAGIELYYLALMHQWDEEITALCVIKEEEK